MTADEIAKLPTPRTDAIPYVLISLSEIGAHSEMLREHARTIEQQLAAAVMALECARRHTIRSKDADADSIWIDETLAAIKERG